MSRIRRLVNRLIRCEQGATATEYAVVIALIAIVVIAAVAALGAKVSSAFVDAEAGF